METSVVSGKPTLYSKPSQAPETSKPAPRQNRLDSAETANKSPATSTDTVQLSAESLQLAKSTNTQRDTHVRAIEDHNKAQQAVQNIVKQMRQQTTAALASQGSAMNGRKLKSLLA